MARMAQLQVGTDAACFTSDDVRVRCERIITVIVETQARGSALALTFTRQLMERYAATPDPRKMRLPDEIRASSGDDIATVKRPFALWSGRLNRVTGWYKTLRRASTSNPHAIVTAGAEQAAKARGEII